MGKKMTLGKAIAKKDMEAVKEVVKLATAFYNVERPDEPMIETVYGVMPVSSVFDKKTKWQLITAAYAEIVNAASRFDSAVDVKIETAKLIATNGILRNLVDPQPKNDSGLL